MSDTVRYRLEPTGRTEHEQREVLLTTACPTCGADWTGRGNGLPRHGSGREYYCTACGAFHRATQVNEHGRPVSVPGWGVTQQRHRMADQHDDEGPAATRR